MSYDVRFTGQFDLDKPLTLEQYNVLIDFAKADRRHDELSGMPGIWCDWVPSRDGKSIKWNQREGSFYDAGEWMTYLIEHFLKPWGYVVNGKVLWQGHDIEDRGVLLVENNVVSSVEQMDAYKLYEDVRALHEALNGVLPLFVLDRGWDYNCVDTGLKALARHSELGVTVRLAEKIRELGYDKGE